MKDVALHYAFETFSLQSYKSSLILFDLQELLRPSGFYRDEDEQKAKLRDEVRKGPMGRTDRVLQMDNRMPILPHPLSFMELERHGFEDLVLPIIEYGGPHNVGVRVGIEWDDPIEEKVQVDESQRPKRVESNAFDIQGH